MTVSEFQSDIKDRNYDEEGHELDKHGFRIKRYPDGFESVRKSVENCEQMCGLDRNVMARLLKGSGLSILPPITVVGQVKKL